jgi:hypothetical protein
MWLTKQFEFGGVDTTGVTQVFNCLQLVQKSLLAFPEKVWWPL